MRGRGDRQRPGNPPPVSGGQLAGVENDRRARGLGDAELDAPASESWVDRVVVAVNTNERLRRDAQHSAAIGVRHRGGQPSAPGLLLREPPCRDRADRAMNPTVRLVGPGVETVLKIEVVREYPAGLEVRAHEPMPLLELPLRLRIPRFEVHPA